MFKLNDHVIYPGHGVAVVEDIVEKTVADSKIEFLKLSFVFAVKDMTILVPVYNVESIGIRYPSSSAAIDVVLQELDKEPERRLEGIDFTPSGWNRRYKDYQNKIQNGRMLDIAKIYRDLMYVAQQKELSYGERQVRQTVEDLLAQEMQIVASSEREQAVQLLRNPFKKLLFHDRSFLQKEAS